MQKLPVLATTGQAFAFLRDEFGTILRLSWLLFLIVAIVQYIATMGAIEAFRSSADFERAMQAMQESSGAGVRDLLVNLISVVAAAIVAVALHRVILFGDRRLGSFVPLAFGKVEFFFVLLPILGMLVFFGLFAVGALVVIPLMTLMGPFAFTLLIGAFLAIGLYVSVRLSLVFPLAVMTRRLRFAESWALTKGNFWRLFGVWILVSLPMLLLVAVIFMLSMPNLAGLNTTDPRAKVDAFAAYLSSVIWIQTIGYFFVSIVGSALGVAVLSYSYKALSGHAPDDILTPPQG